MLQLTAVFFRSLDFDEYEQRLVTALDGDRLHAKVTTPLLPFPVKKRNHFLLVIQNCLRATGSTAMHTHYDMRLLTECIRAHAVTATRFDILFLVRDGWELLSADNRTHKFNI
jgi:hypothetical protein